VGADRVCVAAQRVGLEFAKGGKESDSALRSSSEGVLLIDRTPTNHGQVRSQETVGSGLCNNRARAGTEANLAALPQGDWTGSISVSGDYDDD
jgi:hypothetical protein